MATIETALTTIVLDVHHPYHQDLTPGDVTRIAQVLNTTQEPAHWAEGVSARYRYWDDDTRFGHARTQPLPTHLLAADNAEEAAAFIRLGVSFTDLASWALHHSSEYTVRKPIPIWDQIRYCPGTESYLTSNVDMAWKDCAKKAGQDQLHNMINNTLAGLLTVWNDMMPEFDEDTAKITAKVTGAPIKVPPAVGVWRMVFKALKSNYEAPSGVKYIRERIDSNEIMHSTTEALNRLKGVQVFNNGVLVTEDSVSKLYRIGSMCQPHPEAMVTPGFTVDWPNFDQQIMSEAAEYAMNPTRPAEQPEGLLDMFNEIICETPTFQSFIKHAFREPGETNTILRILGSMVFGKDHKTIFAFIGESNTGKDQLMGILHDILSEGSIGGLPNAVFEVSRGSYVNMDHANFRLKTARIAKLEEEVSSASRLNGARLNTFANGGAQKITGAGKFEKDRSFYFDGPLVMAGNSVPQIQNSGGDAMKNRLVAIPFRHPFADATSNRQSSFGAMYREEGGYIAALFFLFYCYWTAEGGRKGLEVPQEWTEWSQEVLDESDIFHNMDSCFSAPIEGQESFEDATSVFNSMISVIQSELKVPFRSVQAASRQLTTQIGSKPRQKRDGTKVQYVREYSFTPNEYVTSEMFQAARYAAAESLNNLGGR